MIRPEEVYHLGAQSHVRVSFDLPEYTTDVTGLGTVRILEAIRQGKLDTKFYQASSSEMYGESPPPQNEDTPFRPRSPYACSKLFAYWMARNYRDGYGLLCSNGILFNHESPRRGPTFVTRKIAAGVASIVAKKQEFLFLGNLDSKRDWGYAPEYVEVMWKILQRDRPDDYVVGTGENHAVREFLEEAFRYVGLSADNFVRIDNRYLRPTEVNELRADCRKAQKELNWNPRIKFKDLVHILVDAEMRRLNLISLGEGEKALVRAYPDRWWNDNGHFSFSNS
jgi:GDPmannose 4,6-dehydratase